MPNYYMYRINPAYDGFFPSTIPDRISRGIMKYNWAAYVENLERGDIILTYFTGTGCRAGIYGVSVVRDVDNVTARLLRYSCDDRNPLISVKCNRALFERIRTRPRGAEVVVPNSCELIVYKVLANDEELMAEAAKWNVGLPGSTIIGRVSYREIAIVNIQNDLSAPVQNKKLISTFWIRPKQASWIRRSPPWLYRISSIFGSFKSGDMTWLEYFASKMVKQIRGAVPKAKSKFGVVIGVPLNEKKRSSGEVDRVSKLAKSVSERIGVPYMEVFKLNGDISRRLYKRMGLSSSYFRKQYMKQLEIITQQELKDLINSSRGILLIDDVYTDGVTTATVVDALKQKFPNREVDVTIATLGIMAKQNNMNSDLVESWR